MKLRLYFKRNGICKEEEVLGKRNRGERTEKTTPRNIRITIITMQQLMTRITKQQL